MTDRIRFYVRSYVRRRRCVALACAMGWSGALAMAWWFVLQLVDQWFGMTRFTRVSLLIAGLASCSWIVARMMIFMFRRYNPVAVAIEIESRRDAFDQRLITVSSDITQSQLLSQVISEVEGVVGTEKGARLVPLRPLLAPILALIAAFLLLMLVLPIAKDHSVRSISKPVLPAEK